MKLKYIALLLLTLPVLSACDQEDDVIEIFEGKTWKLTNVFFAKGGNNVCWDYWKDEEAYNASEELRQKKGNFVINFTGAEINGNVTGEYHGNAVSTTISGKWEANGKNNTFKAQSDQQPGNNMNILERVYINGLINAYKYEGDTNGNLRIFFKDPDKKDNRFLLFHINNE